MRRMIFIIAVVVSWPTTAGAQQLPPPIKQQVVDTLGVGLKNGRFDGLTVPLISIGGDGAAALSRTYAPQDGRELIVQSIFDVRQSRVYDTPTTFFEHQTVSYPGGSVTFRKISGAYVEEHNTGATLTLSNGIFTFIDKYGVKIEGDKIIYPDGREVWGGTSTSDLASPSLHIIRDIKNNFGFRLRTSGEITQAINMLFDYCNDNYTNTCQNVQFDRRATVQQDNSRYTSLAPNSEMVLTNPSNEVTRVSFKLMDIFFGEPNCININNNPIQTCFGNKFPFYYPEKVTLPGSSSPNIIATYLGSGPPDSVSHNEMVIDTLSVNGVLMDYDIAVYPYAGGGFGGFQSSGSQISVKANKDGIRHVYSHSYNYGGTWPSGNLEIRSIEDGLAQINTYSYNAKGDVSEVRFPEGNRTSYMFDGRFNVTHIKQWPKIGSTETELTTQYEYLGSCSLATQAYCNLPIAMVDPRGNRTDYIYNTRGQLLTETKPAPSAGAARPKMTNTYTMRTAYVKDAGGNLVAAGAPISLLTRTSSCISTASCAGTLDEVATEYDYGPTTGLNNLNLIGVAVTAKNAVGVLETLRTCYRYNYFGEKISETKPSASLASCPAS